MVKETTYTNNPSSNNPSSARDLEGSYGFHLNKSNHWVGRGHTDSSDDENGDENGDDDTSSEELETGSQLRLRRDAAEVRLFII